MLILGCLQSPPSRTAPSESSPDRLCCAVQCRRSAPTPHIRSADVEAMTPNIMVQATGNPPLRVAARRTTQAPKAASGRTPWPRNTAHSWMTWHGTVLRRRRRHPAPVSFGGGGRFLASRFSSTPSGMTWRRQYRHRGWTVIRCRLLRTGGHPQVRGRGLVTSRRLAAISRRRTPSKYYRNTVGRSATGQICPRGGRYDRLRNRHASLPGAAELRSPTMYGMHARSGIPGSTGWRRCAPRSMNDSFCFFFVGGRCSSPGLFGRRRRICDIPALVLLLGIEMGVAVDTSL